jgi:hypothetical protein
LKSWSLFSIQQHLKKGNRPYKVPQKCHSGEGSVSSRNDRNPEAFEITGLLLEFTPYFITGQE